MVHPNAEQVLRLPRVCSSEFPVSTPVECLVSAGSVAVFSIEFALSTP
jgi:hypothetical protein